MDEKDLAQIAGPADRSFRKLLETIVSGFGLKTGSRQIKKQGETALSLAKQLDSLVQSSPNLDGVSLELRDGNIQMMATASQRALSFDQRSDVALRLNAERKQQNRESIIADAAFELTAGDSQVPLSEDPVDPDWTVRFFNIAEDVSDDDMQLIWGRILAGEVCQPGSYSLRTLDLLKNISQKEATLFATLCKFVFNGRFVYYQEGIFPEFCDMSFDDILLLEEAGLLQHSLFFTMNKKDTEKGRLEIWYNSTFAFNLSADKIPTPMPCLKLTKAGIELSTLTQGPRSRKYARLLREFYRQQGFTIMEYTGGGNIVGGAFRPPEWDEDDLSDRKPKEDWGRL
ncbi:MAG: DUF2806 domain-containing protein [Bacteroidetes bacterium]|nr:DUF2806 domain-containing protein [Bacteroidota bacterium]